MPKKGYKDIKEEVIEKRTGKNFNEWRKILDEFNVKENGHKASVAYLFRKYKLNPWWSQVIVIRYEYEKKLR
jgi:hypothetical protein